jgi:hypothetical protein
MYAVEIAREEGIEGSDAKTSRGRRSGENGEAEKGGAGVECMRVRPVGVDFQQLPVLVPEREEESVKGKSHHTETGEQRGVGKEQGIDK